MADSRIRQLKIKTGIVKRLTKEKSVYEKEVEVEKERMAKMKDTGKDEHTLKQQEKVIQDTAQMVPHCQKGILAAYNDLKEVLESVPDLAEKEEYISAQAALKDAELALQG
uniref:Tubulin-specific chaperone A n=1 Tax=Ixodes ricinus TaxID=34613 RepID=A0A0K8RD85_IXORI